MGDTKIINSFIDAHNDIMTESVQNPKIFDAWSLWHFTMGVFWMWWGLSLKFPPMSLLVGLSLLHCIYELRDFIKGDDPDTYRTSPMNDRNNSGLNCVGDQIAFSAGLALGLWCFRKVYSLPLIIVSISIVIFVYALMCLSSLFGK